MYSPLRRFRFTLGSRHSRLGGLYMTYFMQEREQRRIRIPDDVLAYFSLLDVSVRPSPACRVVFERHVELLENPMLQFNVVRFQPPIIFLRLFLIYYK